MSTYHTIDIPLKRLDENRKLSLYESDDVMTLMLMSLRQGISPNGKAWSRWETIDQANFSARTKNIQMYYKRKGQGLINRTTQAHTTMLHFFFPPASLEGQDLILQGLSRFFQRHRGVEINTLDDLMLALYPSLRFWGDVNPMYGEQGVVLRSIPGSLSAAMRSNTYQDFLMSAFGKPRYRKDLVKAVAKNSLFTIAKLQPLATTVPVDWIVDALNAHPTTQKECLDYQQAYMTVRLGRDVKLLLSHAPITRQRQLVHDLLEIDHPIIFHDILRAYNIIVENNVDCNPGFKVSRWSELDTNLSRLHRKLSSVNKPIPQRKIHKKSHGVTTENGLKIITAQDTATLLHWGDIMNNCVGTYGQPAQAGTSVIAGVFDGGVLIANIELTKNGTIKQLLGRRNSSLEYSTQEDILDALLKAEVIKTKNQAFWGMEVG
jgi:PcfJ-like protein